MTPLNPAHPDYFALACNIAKQGQTSRFDAVLAAAKVPTGQGYDQTFKGKAVLAASEAKGLLKALGVELDNAVCAIERGEDLDSSGLDAQWRDLEIRLADVKALARLAVDEARAATPINLAAE